MRKDYNKRCVSASPPQGKAQGTLAPISPSINGALSLVLELKFPQDLLILSSSLVLSAWVRALLSVSLILAKSFVFYAVICILEKQVGTVLSLPFHCSWDR